MGKKHKKSKFGAVAKISVVVPEQPVENMQAVENHLRIGLLETCKKLQLSVNQGLVFVKTEKRGKDVRVTVGIRSE